ncbi:pleckstrin homology domain-containing family M member 3 [Anguilla anguilla]|uniref:pleckstrin homology domain-containing family M member 3 n=1 Tax=Anguilla anguilla TaxID=7936 RepID=UPI0015B06292|nr:pleckstrin homology domain-containing family M member 3 [Anguilla anguilla]
MEGLEVEDVSPALEVTEDFLHCLEGGASEKLQDATAVGRLSSSGVWGLLAAEQLEVSPRNLAWADQPPSFGLFGGRQGKRSRARSTNDLAAHAKDAAAVAAAASSSSNAAFKRGHNRSRSDANYRSCTDNGVPTVDKNALKNMILNGKGDGDKVSSPSLVKQGELEQREGTSGRWTSCHVELTPCELRLYSLDSSGNRHLCTAYSLSHCQGVAAPLPQDARVLQALFFNSTRLQLRASCQWEALDWRRTLWERVLAARPARQRGEEPSQQPQAADPAPCPAPRPAPPPLTRPTALPLFTQRCREVLKAGLLHQLTDLNNWRAFTFVLTATRLQAFATEGRGPVTEPVLRYALASCLAVQRDGEGAEEGGGGGGGAQCRLQVVFPSEVLRLRAESEREARDWAEALQAAAAAQRARDGDGGGGPVAVVMRSRPARERRQRDAQRAKRQSVTTSFLGILTHLAVEKGLTTQSFRCAGESSAPYTSKGAVIEGKLAPFLSKVIKFASSHVYSCSLCSEKGFICELCHNGQVIYPFQESATKRCEGCGAVFHAECRMRAQPCPRCVRRELHQKPASFWRSLEQGDSPADDSFCSFQLPYQDT